MTLGQLIKLQDYISRYELDTYRYAGQFIRLKKQQWEKLKSAWEENSLDSLQSIKQREEQASSDERRFLFNFFISWKQKGEEIESTPQTNRPNEEFGDGVDLSTLYGTQPKTIEELKQVFLDHIFDFQMKWASSTVREKSYVDKEFYYDPTLKFFLQRFPDTYLVLYKPIFLLKKAPIEVEFIIITPTATWCISFLEGKDNSVFVGSNERFWIERQGDREQKVLSPLIGLFRMERIVKKIYSLYNIEMPVRKVVLNRNGFIEFPLVPYNVEIVEKRNYEKWFASMRNMVSPLKHIQLKAANALLQYCQTTCVRRRD